MPANGHHLACLVPVPKSTKQQVTPAYFYLQLGWIFSLSPFSGNPVWGFPQTNASQCSSSAGLAHIRLLNFQAFCEAGLKLLIA